MFYIHYALEVIGILSAILTALGHMTFLPMTWQQRALALGANISLFMQTVRPKSTVGQAITDPQLLKLAELMGKNEWSRLPAREPDITEKKFDPEETLDSPK